MTALFAAEQIATDFGFGDYQARVVLPDGTLAYVGEDYLSGDAVAYRERVCCDYGGNVLGVRRADESCVGISASRTASTTGHSDRVAGVKLTYVRSAGDCTGRQIYRVEVSS